MTPSQTTPVLVLLLALLAVAVPAHAARKCTGAAGCTACKNCNGCAHCAKQGGTCGVCARPAAPPVQADPDRELLRRREPAGSPVRRSPVPPPVEEPPAPREEERPAPAAPAAEEDGVTVYFSPDGGCTDAIVREIGKARRSIDVQAYSFTSAPIAKAVADAHKRGVAVRVVLDKSQRTARYSSATFLFNQGVPVFIDDGHAIAHNKVILIDGQTVVTGSFNFSKAAEESNAENLLVIRGKPKLAMAYAENFAKHLGHAERYEGLAKPEGRVDR